MTRERCDWSVELLAALASFPSVGTEVREQLLLLLDEGGCSSSDLDYISKVRDPRRVEWFRVQWEIGNVHVRQVRRKMFGTRRGLPQSISLSQNGPNRLLELYSTDVDIQDLEAVLNRLSAEYGVKIHERRLSTSVLEGLERATYVKFPGNAKEGTTIWLKREDPTTVQIVLTGAKRLPV